MHMSHSSFHVWVVERTGRTIAGQRAKWVIATKFGIYGTLEGLSVRGDPAYIRCLLS